MISLDWLYDLIGRIPLDAFQYRFMQEALVALVLLAPMYASMGVQAVNFRMAFFSDAISHSALAGAAFGLLMGLADPFFAMVGLAVLIGVGIVAVGRRTLLSADTVIGVFFSTAVAFGLVIVGRDRHVANTVGKFLFGDIIFIGDLVGWLFGLCAVVLAFQAIGYNRLLYVGLNAPLASAHRVHVRVYQYVYAVLLALVAIVSVRTVGILLVTAMLIVPTAAARNLARSAGGMFWWALAIALVSSVAGLILSFDPRIHAPAGAMIVLVASGLFVLSVVIRLPGRLGLRHG